jgi:hypothetical protein
MGKRGEKVGKSGGTVGNTVDALLTHTPGNPYVITHRILKLPSRNAGICKHNPYPPHTPQPIVFLGQNPYILLEHSSYVCTVLGQYTVQLGFRD